MPDAGLSHPDARPSVCHGPWRSLTTASARHLIARSAGRWYGLRVGYRLNNLSRRRLGAKSPGNADSAMCPLAARWQAGRTIGQGLADARAMRRMIWSRNDRATSLGLPVGRPAAGVWRLRRRGLHVRGARRSRGPRLRALGPRPRWCRAGVTSRSIKPCGRPWCWSARSAAATNGPGSAECCPGAAATSMDRPQRAPKVATRAVPWAGAASSASPVSAARSVTPLTWSRSSFQAARAPSPGEDIRHPQMACHGIPEGTSPQAPRPPARRRGPGTP